MSKTINKTIADEIKRKYNNWGRREKKLHLPTLPPSSFNFVVRERVSGLPKDWRNRVYGIN